MIRFHEDAAIFREAVSITQVRTGFAALLIDTELVGLVRQKLAVPGNERVNVSEGRLATLREQLDPQLKPVLRAKDFAEFDLDRAFKLVAEMAAKVS
jgi:hypothetical protein